MRAGQGPRGDAWPMWQRRNRGTPDPKADKVTTGQFATRIVWAFNVLWVDG
jgi:hypothetical protein